MKTDGTSATASTLSTLFEGVRRKAASSFSVVLSPEDLKALEIQNKIQDIRRKRHQAQRAQRNELNELRNGLRERKTALQKKLRDGLDRAEYEDIAEQCLKELSELKAEGVPKGCDGRSRKEGDRGDEIKDDNENFRDEEEESEPVDHEKALTETIRLLKIQHSSDLQDRVNKMLQEQTNDEIMRMYNMEGTIKEDFGEREAKLLSHVVQMDTRLGEIRAGHEETMKVYETMKRRYEKTAQEHVSRVYQALQAKPDTGQDGTGTKNTGSMDVSAAQTPARRQSYSDRLLQVNAEEQEERRKKRASVLEAQGAILEDDGEKVDQEAQNKVEIIFDVGDKNETNDSERSERTAGSHSGHRRLAHNSARGERTVGANSARSERTVGTGRQLSGVRPAASPRLQAARRASLTRPSVSMATSSTSAHTRSSLASRTTSPRVVGTKSLTNSHGGRTNLPARRVLPAGGEK
jgi:hypothetical protein